jgi:SAM-dependent methyltransferase
MESPVSIDDQRQHWDATFAANPDIYGADPAEPALAAAERFARARAHRVLELGAGQGRDTLFFADRGFHVVALDYAPVTLNTIAIKAAAAGFASRVSLVHHDVRDPLPFAEDTFDAHYSNMLFCMALSTPELVHLAAEIRRVLRPGGLAVYTVRHTGDAHFGTGISHGDGMYENGGFVVHFFDRELVDQLASGFELENVVPFIEGDLPRKLWRVTMIKRVDA